MPIIRSMVQSMFFLIRFGLYEVFFFYHC
ncbi:hypothetical protein EVA_22015, partial [gut metagenome]